MKKYVVCIVVGFLFIPALMAQVKPVAGDLGLGFRITGLQNIGINAFDTDETDNLDIPQLLVRYYLSEKIALRTAFGIQLENSSVDFNFNYIDSLRFIEPVTVDSTNNNSVDQFSFSINPGAEYHLVSQASRIDPYVGLTIPITLVGSRTLTEDLDYSQTVIRDGVTLFREDISTKLRTDGGFRVGLDLLAGFNYFFGDNFSVGAEYALGFAYSRIGGTVELSETGVRQVSPDVNNLEPVSNSERFTSLSTSTELGVLATGGVNISIFW